MEEDGKRRIIKLSAELLCRLPAVAVCVIEQLDFCTQKNLCSAPSLYKGVSAAPLMTCPEKYKSTANWTTGLRTESAFVQRFENQGPP